MQAGSGLCYVHFSFLWKFTSTWSIIYNEFVTILYMYIASILCAMCSKGYMHTGKCRFAGIYTYCRYFIDRKW